MRFVWIWPTGIGEVVWDRRAAAAADDERLALDARLARKACTAAVDAAAFGGVFTSCEYNILARIAIENVGTDVLRLGSYWNGLLPSMEHGVQNQMVDA